MWKVPTITIMTPANTIQPTQPVGSGVVRDACRGMVAPTPCDDDVVSVMTTLLHSP
jgi:hypothetical protein